MIQIGQSEKERSRNHHRRLERVYFEIQAKKRTPLNNLRTQVSLNQNKIRILNKI